MRRLVLSNSHAIKFSIFKDVLFDLAITSLDDKTFFSQKFPIAYSNSPPTNALIIARLQNFKMKIAKGQTIFGCLSIAKRSRKTLLKSPILLPVKMELIKSGKQRV